MNRFLSKKNNNTINKSNKNSIEKMDFPDLIVSKKSEVNANENSYKNMINKEIIVKKETLPEGWIVLKEGQQNNPIILKENQVNDMSFYNNIISTQIYLDKVNDAYRENFIELHGEELYDKYYTMTDSHIYIEKEEEEQEKDNEEDDYYEYE